MPKIGPLDKGCSVNIRSPASISFDALKYLSIKFLQQVDIYINDKLPYLPSVSSMAISHFCWPSTRSFCNMLAEFSGLQPEWNIFWHWAPVLNCYRVRKRGKQNCLCYTYRSRYIIRLSSASVMREEASQKSTLRVTLLLSALFGERRRLSAESFPGDEKYLKNFVNSLILTFYGSCRNENESWVLKVRAWR